MDNTQMSQFQNGMPEQMPPMQGYGAGMPPVQQPNQFANGGALPMVQQVPVKQVEKKNISGLIKTIVIVILSLIAVTFIGLFIWMFTQYSEARNDIDDEVSRAVAKAKDEQRTADDERHFQDEKLPYKNFAGPVDYGELSFQYPKTWSVYIEKDAVNGGDFVAYLNPNQVNPISNTNVDALRVTIFDQSFEKVVEKYQKELDKKDAPLTMESVTVNGVTANRYTGTIPGTQFQGYIIIFKIRDKTAELRTDSVLFKDDYDKLIETITFNA